MRTISFSVPGTPKPAGSKSGFITTNKDTGKQRVLIVDACKGSKAWKKTVAAYARKAYRDEPVVVPIRIRMWFTMPRPRSHYRQGKFSPLLKKSTPEWHTYKPDVLKLARAVEDALTGIIYKDDAQIVLEKISKTWGARGVTNGVWIKIDEAKTEDYE